MLFIRVSTFVTVVFLGVVMFKFLWELAMIAGLFMAVWFILYLALWASASWEGPARYPSIPIAVPPPPPPGRRVPGAPPWLSVVDGSDRR